MTLDPAQQVTTSNYWQDGSSGGQMLKMRAYYESKRGTSTWAEVPRMYQGILLHMRGPNPGTMHADEEQMQTSSAKLKLLGIQNPSSVSAKPVLGE